MGSFFCGNLNGLHLTKKFDRYLPGFYWTVFREVFLTGISREIFHFTGRNFSGMIVSGRVAEWLMAPVLKTGKLTLRRFESCPFRQKVVP